MLRRAFIPAAALVALAFTIPTLAPDASPPRRGVQSFQDVRDAPSYSVEGLNEAYAGIGRWAEALHANEVRAELQAEVARLRAVEANRTTTRPTRTTSPAITGSCAEMKPPGFPDYIIWRESRGDPNALNPSGAYGCAQLMPSTGGSGTYAERWARTWANGAGACHWNAPNYCGG